MVWTCTGRLAPRKMFLQIRLCRRYHPAFSVTRSANVAQNAYSLNKTRKFHALVLPPDSSRDDVGDTRLAVNVARVDCQLLASAKSRIA